MRSLIGDQRQAPRPSIGAQTRAFRVSFPSSNEIPIVAIHSQSAELWSSALFVSLHHGHADAQNDATREDHQRLRPVVEVRTWHC